MKLFIQFILICSFFPANAKYICKPLERNKRQLKIEQSLNQLISAVEDEQLFNLENCSSVLYAQSKFFFNDSESAFVDHTEKAFQEFTPMAPDIVRLFWKLKLKLRDKLTLFYQQQPNSPLLKECSNSFRVVYRYIRYAEESINEWYVNRCDDIKSDIQPESFHKSPSQFWINPEYYKSLDDFKLKSGDLLLTRGSSFVSAAISRIGDEQGQFSHLAMVYQHPNTKKLFVVEALIETGSIIYPLQDWIVRHPLTRLAIFRYKGTHLSREAASELAAKAAAVGFHKMTPSGEPLHELWLDKNQNMVSKKEQHKNVNKDLTIRYDFPMDYTDHSTLFCSEVIGTSYEEVTGEKLPAFLTEFKKGIHHPFFKTLTIEVDETFGPSDIELDPRFDLIGEWRNPFLSNETKLADATFNVMFQLMFQKGYEIDGGWLQNTFSDVVLQARKRFNLFADRMPPYIPAGFTRKIFTLESIYENILQALNEENQNHVQTYGYNLTYPRAVNFLETAFEGDCAKSLKMQKLSRSSNAPGKRSKMKRLHKEKTLDVHNKFNVKAGSCWNPLLSFDELSSEDWQQIHLL